ncbi:MAG: HAMP domain-containing protein [Verrucomicrobiaceae bacterium]|nr:MAG: HAMP domain-containing protein [Verrucomicrobiaceae bacterium]
MSSDLPGEPVKPSPRNGRTVSFRSILLAVILGLILASSISTTWFGANGLGTVIRTLLGRQIETTLDAVTGRVEDLFEPSDRLLHTFSKRVRNGTFSVTDPLNIARNFSETLEFEEGIKGIYFGYADGSLAGAWQDHGQSVLIVSSPNGGPWQEWKQDPEGNLVPFVRDSVPASFDARERIWFQLAKAHDGLAWSPPYEFAGEGHGLSVSEAVRSADGTLIGVVTVDFLLKDVTDYLESLKQQYKGDTLVFSIRGNILASPKDLDSDPIVEHIREKIEGQDAWQKIRREGGHFVTDFTVNGQAYIAGVRGASVPGDLDCVSAIIFSRSQAFGPLLDIIYHGILTALVALILSLAAGFLLAGRIATPLKSLAAAVARIGRFDLTQNPMPRSTVREIRALSDSIELMRTGLRSFSHYVPVDLVRDLVQGGGVAALGGERRNISIMFCDLAGFTSYAENIAPEKAVEILTGYFEDFGGAIDGNDGVIDKFLGDGMMAIFNAPNRIEAPAAAACRAALQGISAMGSRDGGFTVRVGLHCGECLVGNVGTETRFTYTAIGDCVNLASRLEGMCVKLAGVGS